MLDLHVVKRHNGFVLDVQLELQARGVTALLGPSGAGKTTLVDVVAGLLEPDAGHVKVMGRTLFDAGAGVNVPPEKRNVGYVFQDARLFPHMSVAANLEYGMRLLDPDRRRVGVDEVTELLGLGELMKRRPATLSGGEKQRVAIGRALLSSPRILLMDEPLASLDETRKKEVMPFVTRLWSELQVPVLYVTHSLDEVMQMARVVVRMGDGKVLATQRVEQMVLWMDGVDGDEVGDGVG